VVVNCIFVNLLQFQLSLVKFHLSRKTAGMFTKHTYDWPPVSSKRRALISFTPIRLLKMSEGQAHTHTQ
jgi:hypothetical protein